MSQLQQIWDSKPLQIDDDMPTVLSITDGFKAVQAEYGPDFRCGTCDIAVDP
jgi:hypothetical protein